MDKTASLVCIALFCWNGWICFNMHSVIPLCFEHGHVVTRVSMYHKYLFKYINNMYFGKTITRENARLRKGAK